MDPHEGHVSNRAQVVSNIGIIFFHHGIETGAIQPF